MLKKVAHEADPLDAARRWRAQAAHFMHVVDLDGALSGKPENLETVAAIPDRFMVVVSLKSWCGRGM